MKNKNNAEEIDTYVLFILNDVKKLSNFYWAIGCIDASLILFQLVQYYFEEPNSRFYIDRFFMPAKTNQFSWIRKYDDNNTPYPVLILEAAVENLYLAKLLANFEQSKVITDHISHGKGLMAGHEESFKTLDELQNLVMKKLDMLELPLVESFCRNAFEHSIKTIKKYYPDFEHQQDLSQLKQL